MNAKKFKVKFQSDEKEHTHSTYGAIEIFLDELRTKASIESIVIKNHEFLIDSARKKGLALSFVTWKWKPKTDHASRPGDFMKRCVTVNSYHIIVKAFFASYPDFTLAVDIGTKDHDTIIFTQKIKGGGHGKPSYTHIHFNPNVGEEVGVVTHYVQKMSANYLLSGYHSQDGNSNGECSLLCWAEVFKFIRLSFNPFADKRIDLWPADKRNRRWKYTYLEDILPDTENEGID